MKGLPIKDYLNRIGIGQHVVIHLKGNRIVQAILSGIDTGKIYYKDEIGLKGSRMLEDIVSIEVPDVPLSTSLSASDQKRLHVFVAAKRKLGNEARYNPKYIFSDSIHKLQKVFDGTIFKEYFTANRISSVYLDDTGYKEFVTEFNTLQENGVLDVFTVFVGRILTLLYAKRYKDCAATCFNALQQNIDMKHKLKLYRTLSYIMGILKDDDQSYYWLNKYYSLYSDEINEKDPLWWKYLDQSVEFSSYDELRNEEANVNLSSAVRKYSEKYCGNTIYSIAAPSSAPDVRRANSEDTFRFFLKHFDVQSGKKLLLITSCIYVPFQLLKFMDMAIDNGFEVDCVGAEVADKCTFSKTSNYLQEIKAVIDAAYGLVQTFDKKELAK